MKTAEKNRSVPSDEERERILSFPFCSIPEASAVRGFSRQWGHRLVRDGRWPAVVIGNRWMVPTGILRDEPEGETPSTAA